MRAILIVSMIELLIIVVLVAKNVTLKRKRRATQRIYWTQARKMSNLEHSNLRLSFENQDLNKQLAGAKAVLLGITFQIRKRNNADMKRLEE